MIEKCKNICCRVWDKVKSIWNRFIDWFTAGLDKQFMALKISESAAVQMPMKTVASLIVLVAMGVFAYTELTSRLVSLETSRELFENDLLKKSEQVPTDQEQHFLIEDLYKTVEKMEQTQEMNMTNKVNIEFLKQQLEKALSDVEDLKDKVRANGNGAH